MGKAISLGLPRSGIAMRGSYEADPNCEYCDGTGEVIGDSYDRDSHCWMPGAGYPQRCVCVSFDEETETDE